MAKANLMREQHMGMRKLSTKMSEDASDTSAEWAKDIVAKPREKVGEKVKSWRCKNKG